jgi:hypothetical protein
LKQWCCHQYGKRQGSLHPEGAAYWRTTEGREGAAP